MENAHLDELANLLRLLGDPTRLRIFDLLLQGPQCNCVLGGQLGLPMNLISHHFRVLREAGLVDTVRDPEDARWVYYSVNQEKLNALRGQLLAFLDAERERAVLPACAP